MQPRYWRLGLLLIAAGALLFWGRGLGQRPMHQDEAIGADKFHSSCGNRTNMFMTRLSITGRR
jgi:predicted membrane-bound mannosyltransferase